MPMLKIAFDLGVQLAREEACIAKQADDPMANLVEKLRNIEWPWQKEEPSAFSTWKPYAAGAAAGLGAYGLMRHKFLADPKKYPVLRKLQDLTGGEMSRFGIEGAPKEPTLLDKIKRYFTYGDELYGQKLDAMGDIPEEMFAKNQKNPKAVFWGHDPEALPKGTFDPALGPYTKKDEMEGAYAVAEDLFNDKWKQYELLNKYAPGSMPTTINVQDFMKQRGLQLRGSHMREDLETLQAALKEELGGKEYLLKTRAPREGGDPTGQSTMASFPTSQTDLAKAWREWMGIRKQVRNELQEATTKTDVTRKYRNDPAYVGRVVDELLHGNVIAQEKIPIRMYKGRTAEKMRAAGASPTEEYRVHAIGGQAPSRLASPRFDAGLPNVIRGKLQSHRAASSFQDVIDKLPPEYRSMMFAADVAPLEGSDAMKIIELNQGGKSGLLEKPLMNHPLYRTMTGHWPVPVAAAGGVGAAAAGTGLGGAAMNMAQDN